MKLIINGANGRMGHIVADMAGEENIATRVDIVTKILTASAARRTVLWIFPITKPLKIFCHTA